MAGSEDDIPPPPPPPSQTPTQTRTQQTPHTVSTIKLPILKKGEYDIWAMKMEHYLAHTDYPIWKLFKRKWSPREEKEKKSDHFTYGFTRVHLDKIHKITVLKEMWEAIKYRFGGNDKSKKIQKYILKQQFEGFSISNSKGLHKGYDRFQSLLSQLETHSAGVSTEDAKNQNLPLGLSTSAWSQVLLIHEDQARSDSSFDNLINEIERRKMVKQEVSKKSVTLDGEGVDWTSHSEDKQENYALMACSSSGSETEREQLGDASIEIQAYTPCFKENDKTDVLTYHKKLLAEAEKEKEELKAKVEKWHNSSKSLNILLNSQMSARDKAGLGYGDQMNKGVLSYENEVFGSLFDSRASDIEDSPVNDRYAEGMHAVPPPMTGIYIPSGPDKEIDDSQFTYGPKQSKPSESDARSSDFTSCESNSSEETHESMPETVVNEPKVVSQPKVWTDAPIIEEYESDSDDEHVSLPSKEQETPSFANTIKHIKTPRQTVKQQNTCSKSPKPDKKDCSGLISKKLGLGYGFTTKACFVCGSLSHLIRDCDFHEKMMAKQVELNKQKGKGNVQRENKPV
ncbi:hypothetical protein Tco_0051375 [Tanacetum coccineum]